MKRVFSLFLSAILMLFLLASCSVGMAERENATRCAICSNETSSQLFFDAYSGYVCSDCILSSPDDFVICPDCGVVTSKDDIDLYPNWESQVCQTCREKYYRVCIFCEDTPFHRDEMVRAGGYCLCADCAFMLALKFDNEDEVIKYIEENSLLPTYGYYWFEY